MMRQLQWLQMPVSCMDLSLNGIQLGWMKQGEKMMDPQYLFKDEGEYYLVEIYGDKVTLKVKRNGWSDTWSLPLEQTRGA